MHFATWYFFIASSWVVLGGFVIVVGFVFGFGFFSNCH